jgi:hypothetical protein
MRLPPAQPAATALQSTAYHHGHGSGQRARTPSTTPLRPGTQSHDTSKTTNKIYCSRIIACESELVVGMADAAAGGATKSSAKSAKSDAQKYVPSLDSSPPCLSALVALHLPAKRGKGCSVCGRVSHLLRGFACLALSHVARRHGFLRHAMSVCLRT